MKRILVVFVGFLLIGCGALSQPRVPRVRTIPGHLRTGDSIDPVVVNTIHNEKELGVRVRVWNNTPLPFYVVLECAFCVGSDEECGFEYLGQEHIPYLSVNIVALSMESYAERRVWVFSSRLTEQRANIQCRITDESHEINSTTVTVTRPR